jgi:hypothetical protein
MAHTSTENLSPAQRSFAEMVQRGDDFYKIELLRHAKSWYKKALEFKMETEKIEQKLADCEKKLKSEVKVIRILALIAIAAVVVYFLVGS